MACLRRAALGVTMFGVAIAAKLSVATTSAPTFIGEYGADLLIDVLLMRVDHKAHRRFAAEALGGMSGEGHLDGDGVEEAIGALKYALVGNESYGKDQSSQVRKAAAEALGSIDGGYVEFVDGNPRLITSVAVGALSQALVGNGSHAKDEVAAVRKAAAIGLGKAGSSNAILGVSDMQAIEALGHALEGDGQLGVRKAAAEALGCFGGQEGAEVVMELLGRALVGDENHENKDEHPIVRKAAAESLGGFIREEAVQVLSSALMGDDKDQDWSVRESAAAALGDSGDTMALQPLLEALVEDEVWQVRAAAAEALGNMGDEDLLDVAEAEEVIKALSQALVGDAPYAKDEAAEVRSAAAEALQKASPEEGDGDCREEAILALRRALNGDDDYARDENGDVRKAARKALKRLF